MRSMYIIIVGARGIGETLIDKFLVDHKHNIVVVDKDIDTCNRIAQKYDIVVINGDATQSEILDECDIQKADVLVTTTDNDSVNLLTISLARNKNVKRFVSLVNREESIPLYMEKGAKIVREPNLVMAKQLQKAINHPRIQDSIAVGSDSEIISLTVDSGTTASDSFIQEIQLPSDSVIISVIRDNKLFFPKQTDKLHQDDQLTILTKTKLIDRIIELFSS